MIAASQPVTYGGLTYDGFTVQSLNGRRVETGYFALTLAARRCRLIESGTGSTQTLQRGVGSDTVTLDVSNVYSPALSLGDWWTDAARAATLGAAAAVEAAAGAVLAAKGEADSANVVTLLQTAKAAITAAIAAAGG